MGTERYEKEINDLRDYFAARLPACGPINLTPEERKNGVDSLAQSSLAAALVRSACTEWLLTRNYELSYNQVCCAFFAALDFAALTARATPPPTEAPAKCVKCGCVNSVGSNGLCMAPAIGHWEDWRTTGAGRDVPPCGCKCEFAPAVTGAASESTLDLEAIEARHVNATKPRWYAHDVANSLADIPALLAEIKRLRTELLKQWECNHSERCGCADVNGPMCQWRYPEVLGIYQPEF